MANLRLLNSNAADARTIKVRFSQPLHDSITKEMIAVESASSGTPDSAVLGVLVQNDILIINVRPLTPYIRYKVTFTNSDAVRISDVTGQYYLPQDGTANVTYVLGSEDPSNLQRDNLVTLLKDNIYNLDRGTTVRLILDMLGEQFKRLNADIYQARNDNYLQLDVTDEEKIRGYGPWDRLNEEGAYEVFRVGVRPENPTISGIIDFDSFPSDPVTLQRRIITGEQLLQGTGSGTFDKFVLTVGNSPVTKLTAVTIFYQDGYTYEYDIRTYGYQIKDPKYDTTFGSTFLTLEENQFQLNNQILDDSSFVRIPGGGDVIQVSYEHKNLGITVDDESVTVTQQLPATREPVPPILTEFSLDHAPIVTSSGATATRNGVQWLDPSSETPFLTTHPAFETEIQFSYGSLPRNPGEYSVDYETGRVFVWGAETNDGTGFYPPAATYNYKKTFSPNLDYTYEPDGQDVVSSPLRDLTGQEAQINFTYEQVLVPGQDYVAGVHTEAINERIENRLLTSNSLQTLHAPVTNAFRIYNETTQEVYGVSRWNGNKIVFSYNVPPNIKDKTAERASFHSVPEETLIVARELRNTTNVRIFVCNILNENLIGSTEDLIGSSFNNNIIFSRSDVFEKELYYDSQVLTEAQNVERLTVGRYQINYEDGTVYVGVSNGESLNLGSVSYLKPVVDPDNSHVIAVSDIYHSVNLNFGVSKRLNYSSFGEDEITPTTFDRADERFLNGDTSLPYVVSNSTITVQNDIKTLRHLYDVFDLNNNEDPIDFATAATWSANVITLDSIGVEQQTTAAVNDSLQVIVPTVSPGIVIGDVKSVLRVSDGLELLDGYESITGNTIQLAASSDAASGNIVSVVYSVVMNGAATPVVDYDRGAYYIDYTYLADEILVSYEYGDNVIDFRESDTLGPRDRYFVTYRAGALRDALQSNFGTLVNLPELNAVDVELDREVYRDCLSGALQTFTKGPTIPAIKQLVKSVTKIEPDIEESAFDVWSLGISRLFQRPVRINGNPELRAGKFDQGAYFGSLGDSLSFPVSSNLRLEEGNLEMWVIPDWDGLDDDATLTFSSLQRDGYVLSASEIFIGSTSYNPTLDDDGNFSVSKYDSISPVGLPSATFTKRGMFIYYDDDVSRWKVLAKDQPQDDYDGYVYSGNISSSGEVYDVKYIENLGEIDDVLRSGMGTIEFELRLNARDKANPDGYATGDGYVPGYSFDGFSFKADDHHYLFDFAEAHDKNRFSLYKDGRGYLVFEIWDKGPYPNQKPTRRNHYRVSHDIKDWSAGEKHHVAISWALNNKDRRDEMHLYIDGEEVPNIIKYGGIPSAASTDRFRTVVPEVVVGTVPLPIVVGNDLVTNQGSNIVRSASRNFTSEGIVVGHTIEILEQGFSTYTITVVSGNELELSSSMPATLSDASFSVNPFSAVVSTELDLYDNLAVSLLSGGTETELPGLRADIPGYSIEKNGFNQNVLTILGDAAVGDQVLIRVLGKNHRRCRERVYLWNEQSILKTALPPPINLDDTKIIPVTLDYTVIGPDNAAIVGSEFQATLNATTQPSNSLEGRHLTVRITGGNVDFGTDTEVIITGVHDSGVTETVSFNAAGIQSTANKWKTITSIEVHTTPLTTSRNGIGVEIKESYSITRADGNVMKALIRFAWQVTSGLTLQGDGGVLVSDSNNFFSFTDIDNVLEIEDATPNSVVGTYKIKGRQSGNTVRLDAATGSSFTDGKYGIYNTSIGRSGFQNGFFFVQRFGSPNTAYPLPPGVYEFDYAAHLEVPFDPVGRLEAHIGNSFDGTNPAKAVIDEFRILNVQLTDTRVGESIGLNEESVTTSANALRPFTKNQDTLMLLHFEELPPENDSDYYVFANREYIQSGRSVNSRFGHSIVIKEKGLEFENKNRLTTKTEGSIEFWVSPRFDTYNDPKERVYFDAAANVVEEVTSLTKATVQTAGRIRQVLFVRLEGDTGNTGVNYYTGGSLGSDARTITLGQPLPFQQTPVRVAYVPTTSQGDRLTIFKDTSGGITFRVQASGKVFDVRKSIFWPRDSWHRIRASFKFNSVNNLDEIRLFVDGEERNIIRFGQGLVFGQGVVFGQANATTGEVFQADMNFLDTINNFSVGMDFTGSRGAQARFDNFKISNRIKDPIVIGDQPRDVYYNTNSDVLYPAIEDAFTTFLMDFDQLVEKTEDFAILRDPAFGIFNFTLNIIDSFDIVVDDERVRTILEAMINALKPANSKVEINYIT